MKLPKRNKRPNSWKNGVYCTPKICFKSQNVIVVEKKRKRKHTLYKTFQQKKEKKDSVKNQKMLKGCNNRNIFVTAMWDQILSYSDWSIRRIDVKPQD